MIAALVLAGVLQLLIAAANLLLPRLFEYRRHLPTWDPALRQIHVLHGAYLIATVALFGVLCVAFPRALAGGGMGRFLCGALALFWGWRLALQVVYVDVALSRRFPRATVAFVAAVAALTAIFAWVAIAS